MLKYILALLLFIPAQVWGAVFVGFGQIAASEWVVEDSFGTDTSANYTSHGANTLSIGSGIASQSGIYSAFGAYYNETSIGSANQIVRAKVKLVSSAGVSWVLLRSNGTTGYAIGPLRTDTSTDRITISSVNGQSTGFVGSIFFTGSKTWTAGSVYLIEASINGTTISIKIDWNNDGDFGDTNEADMGTVTDSTISSGNYAGISFYNNGSQSTVDDFKAKAY